MINLIIIGAKNNLDTYNSNDVNSFNNPQQADYNSLLKLIEKYKNIKIYNFDMYEENKYNSDNIYFYRKYYDLGDTQLFDKESHNIIIDFCNKLNENYVSDATCKQGNIMQKYNEYKFTWITCGCLWDAGFPLETLEYIIDNKYYTPSDYESVDCFLNTIVNTQKIINDDKLILMKPYSQGVYEVMGTLIWRGYKGDNYKTEKVLYELFNIIEFPFITEKQLIFNKFINKEIHWNELSYDIRKYLTIYIYGTNIDLKK